MAERPRGYGFSAEVKNKINAKYDKHLEQEAMEWIVHWLPALADEKPSGQKVIIYYLNVFFSLRLCMLL